MTDLQSFWSAVKTSHLATSRRRSAPVCSKYNPPVISWSRGINSMIPVLSNDLFIGFHNVHVALVKMHHLLGMIQIYYSTGDSIAHIGGINNANVPRYWVNVSGKIYDDICIVWSGNRRTPVSRTVTRTMILVIQPLVLGGCAWVQGSLWTNKVFMRVTPCDFCSKSHEPMNPYIDMIYIYTRRYGFDNTEFLPLKWPHFCWRRS